MPVDFDFKTYAGIVAAVWVIVEIASKYLPRLVKGREDLTTILITLGTGVLAKLTIEGAFTETDWLTHMVMLLCASFAAQVAHDKLINPVKREIGWKPKVPKP